MRFRSHGKDNEALSHGLSLEVPGTRNHGKGNEALSMPDSSRSPESYQQPRTNMQLLR